MQTGCLYQIAGNWKNRADCLFVLKWIDSSLRVNTFLRLSGHYYISLGNSWNGIHALYTMLFIKLMSHIFDMLWTFIRHILSKYGYISIIVICIPHKYRGYRPLYYTAVTLENINNTFCHKHLYWNLLDDKVVIIFLYFVDIYEVYYCYLEFYW